MDRDVLLNELLRRYQHLLKGIIRDYFRDLDDASDVYQNLCILLLNRLRNEADSMLDRWDSAAWLRVVARNYCRDKIREGKYKNRIDTVNYENDEAFYAAIHGSSVTVHDEIRQFESRLNVDLVEAMSQLNERDRKLIDSRFFEKKSIQEINDNLNITNASVYIERALRKLRKIIGELGEHDGFEIIDR